MKMRRLFLIFISFILIATLVGCASTRQVRLGDYKLSKKKLNPNASMYIVIPNDATYGPKTCYGTGKAVAKSISSSFSKYLKHIETDGNIEDLNKAISKAKSLGFNYVTYPTILMWRDHATEWNGLRDRVEVKVAIYNVNSGEILDSTIVEGVGTWFTLGGYHPHHILQVAMDRYASSLF